MLVSEEVPLLVLPGVGEAEVVEVLVEIPRVVPVTAKGLSKRRRIGGMTVAAREARRRVTRGRLRR